MIKVVEEKYFNNEQIKRLVGELEEIYSKEDRPAERIEVVLNELALNEKTNMFSATVKLTHWGKVSYSKCRFKLLLTGSINQKSFTYV